MALRQLGGRLLGSAVGPSLRAPAALHLVALFASIPDSPVDAVEVAKALQAQEFLNSELANLSAARSAISHGELLDIMTLKGFTPGTAADVISRLEKSGALLNLRGTILLRPGEVAEALALVLPSSLNEACERLQSAKEELTTLDEQQAKIGRRAAWRQTGLMWAGLGSQLALWGLLYRLTFYELSWDVMEPICFFVGGGQALACYAYFMLTRSEFGWEAALNRYVGRWEAAQLQRAGFDLQRYARLKQEVQRLTEFVQATERQTEWQHAAAQGGQEGQPQQGHGEGSPPAGGGKKDA